MATFLASISLQNQTSGTTAQFRFYLALTGFQRSLLAANDDTYELPDNHYIVQDVDDHQTVMNKVMSAAYAVDLTQPPQLVVIELTLCKIAGLTTANRMLGK
jgi:hypothetical protein